MCPFLVPGLIMLSVITQATSNAAFGIHLPKYTGTIYELLSAPVNTFENYFGIRGGCNMQSSVHRLGHTGNVGQFLSI